MKTVAGENWGHFVRVSGSSSSGVLSDQLSSDMQTFHYQNIINNSLSQWHRSTDIDHDDRRTRTNCATRTMSSLSSWSVLTNMFHFHATLESRPSRQNVWNLISSLTYPFLSAVDWRGRGDAAASYWWCSFMKCCWYCGNVIIWLCSWPTSCSSRDTMREKCQNVWQCLVNDVQHHDLISLSSRYFLPVQKLLSSSWENIFSVKMK